MSTVVSRLESVLSAQTRDFDRAMDKSHGKMQRVGTVARTAGLAIAGGLTVALGVSVKAALSAESSERRLEQAFKNSHLALGPYVKRIQQAEAAGRKLGFTDEATKDSLGSLLTATHNYGLAVKDMGVAQAVARFKGIDLSVATKILTGAMAGSQRATKQLGLSISADTTEADKLKATFNSLTPAQKKATEETYKHDLALAKIIDKHRTAGIVIQTVKQRLEGQAKAYADSAAGGMEQFRAQLDHLEVSLGTGLIPALTVVSQWLSTVTEWFSKNQGAAKVLFVGLGALAGVLLSVSVATKVVTATLKIARAAVLAATAAQWLWNVAMSANPIGVIILAIAALVAIMVVLERKYGILTTAVQFLTKHWQLLLIPIGLIPAAIALVITKFDLIHVAVQALNAGLHAMKRVLDKIVDIFKWIIDKAGAIGGAVGGIAGAIGGAAGAVAGKLNPRGEGGPGMPAGARGPVGGDMGQIVGAANAIDSKRFPYLWGGGHSGSTMNGPYDCSGAVSALLRAGGLMSGSMVSGDFMSYGKPGLGKHISILANPEHVYTIINGKAWGTSGQNPGGGAGWFSGGVRSGFAIRHPEGFDSGGWLKPGLTLAMNNTGRPERVLGPGEGGNVVFNFPNYVGSKQELMSMLRDAAAQFSRRNNRTALG